MKVGYYVRTEISSFKSSKIGKIKEISEYFIHTDIGTYDKEDIIKSSPNIIDLIEVGDYVNGMIVNDIVDNRFNLVGYFDNWLEEKDIKSIVTKEQFESMEYKL